MVVGVALAVAIAVAAPALAPGLLALLGTTTATALALTAATVAIGIGLSLTAALVMSAVAGKPSTPFGAAALTTFRQSITNARILYGKRRAGGVIVFFHPRKVGKTQYRYFVIAVAGHRCKGVTQFYLNDEAVTVDGSGKVTSGDYANAAWLWFERGDENATANATFVSECAPKWTTNHRGRGVAKIYAKFEMTDAVVQAGMPNITAVWEGRDQVRDPRTGILGYTRNAAAIFYDWLAMPREEGGFGAYPDEIPDDDWISAQCNICDEAIPLRAGGTEERYAFDSVIEVGAAPADVRQTFVTCCAGTYTYSGGHHLMRPGYYVPVTSELQEEDLAGAIGLPLLADEAEVATEVSGTFIDPTTNYQPQPVPTRSYAATDIRQVDIDLPHITSHPRGQRILEIMLRRSKAELRPTWPMNIMGLAVASMDTVRLDTTRYNLSNYAFTVTSWGMSSDFNVVLGLKEEDPDFYAWTSADELLPGEVPTLDRADPILDGRAAHTIITQSIAYPVTSDDDSIIIAAFRGTVDDGRIIDFPAGEIDGLASGTNWIILWNSTTAAYEVVESPAVDELADPNYIYIATYSTSTAGVYPGQETPPGGYVGGGGVGCPILDASVLLANEAHTGPGATIRAGDLQAGMWVWSKHETTGVWGAYLVTKTIIFESDLVTVEGRPETSPSHLWEVTDGWRKAETMGQPAGRGLVVLITVADAHTYVIVSGTGEWLGSHNKVANSPE